MSATATRERSQPPIRVLIPGLLRSYTAGADRVDVALQGGEQDSQPLLGDAMAALDARFPGLRFRIIDEQGHIRAHIKLFVDGELARDLGVSLPRAAEVMIVGALSGG